MERISDWIFWDTVLSYNRALKIKQFVECVHAYPFPPQLHTGYCNMQSLHFRLWASFNHCLHQKLNSKITPSFVFIFFSIIPLFILAYIYFLKMVWLWGSVFWFSVCLCFEKTGKDVGYHTHPYPNILHFT